MEYNSFLEKHEHALAKAKQEVDFLGAILAKQKSDMSANGVSLKSRFAEVSRISK